MGEYRTFNYTSRKLCIFYFSIFAPKSTKPDRERVEMNERNLEITISKCAFHCIRSFSLMAKTYLITRTSFDLKLESFMQEFILFLSPLAASLLLVGLALFAKGKNVTI